MQKQIFTPYCCLFKAICNNSSFMHSSLTHQQVSLFKEFFLTWLCEVYIEPSYSPQRPCPYWLKFCAQNFYFCYKFFISRGIYFKLHIQYICSLSSPTSYLVRFITLVTIFLELSPLWIFLQNCDILLQCITSIFIEGFTSEFKCIFLTITHIIFIRRNYPVL